MLWAAAGLLMSTPTMKAGTHAKHRYMVPPQKGNPKLAMLRTLLELSKIMPPA